MMIHPNGDITFLPKEKVPQLSMYIQKQAKPLVVLTPKFSPCQQREFKGKRLPCGILNLKWTCKLKKIQVGIRICEGCNEPEEKRNPTSVGGN